MRRQFVWFLLCLMPVGGLMGAKKRRLSAEMAKKVDFWEAKETEGISLRENQLKDTMAGTGETGDAVEWVSPEVARVGVDSVVNIASEGLGQAALVKAGDSVLPGEKQSVAETSNNVEVLSAHDSGVFKEVGVGSDARMVYQTPREELAAQMDEFKRLLVRGAELAPVKQEEGDWRAAQQADVQSRLEQLGKKVETLAANRDTLSPADQNKLNELQHMVNMHLYARGHATKSFADQAYVKHDQKMYQAKINKLLKTEQNKLNNRLGSRIKESVADAWRHKELGQLKSIFASRVRKTIIDREVQAILHSKKSIKEQKEALGSYLTELTELDIVSLKELQKLEITSKITRQEKLLKKLLTLRDVDLVTQRAEVDSILGEIDKRSTPEAGWIRNGIARMCGCKDWQMLKEARAFDEQIQDLNVDMLLGLDNASEVDRLNMMDPVTDRQQALIRLIKDYINQNRPALQPTGDASSIVVRNPKTFRQATATWKDLKKWEKEMQPIKEKIEDNIKIVVAVGLAVTAVALVSVVTFGTVPAAIGAGFAGYALYKKIDSSTGGALGKTVAKTAKKLLPSKKEKTAEELDAEAAAEANRKSLMRERVRKAVLQSKLVKPQAVRLLEGSADPVVEKKRLPERQQEKIEPETQNVPIFADVD